MPAVAGSIPRSDTLGETDNPSATGNETIVQPKEASNTGQPAHAGTTVSEIRSALDGVESENWAFREIFSKYAL